MGCCGRAPVDGADAVLTGGERSLAELMPQAGAALMFDVAPPFRRPPYILRIEDGKKGNSHFEIKVVGLPADKSIRIMAFTPPDQLANRSKSIYQYSLVALDLAQMNGSFVGPWIGIPFVFFGVEDSKRDNILTTCVNAVVSDGASVTLNLTYLGNDPGAAGGRPP